MKTGLRVLAALGAALALVASSPFPARSRQADTSQTSWAPDARRPSQSDAERLSPAALARQFGHARGTLLLSMDGTPVQVALTGTAPDSLATSGAGEASDTDVDGLDQVDATFTALALHGSSTLGSVLVRLRSASLSPFQATLGELEEQANNTFGVLDVAPFTATGTVNGEYAAFLEVEIAGIIYHNELALSLEGLFHRTPPLPGEAYESQNSVQLYDQAGEGTRNSITSLTYIPVPWLVMLPLTLRN